MFFATRNLLFLFMLSLFAFTLAVPAPEPQDADASFFYPPPPPPKPNPPKPSKTTTTPVPTPTHKCNTGPIQCCQKVTSAKDPSAGIIIRLLGIVIRDLNVVVGLTCSPLSAIGLGGNSWCVSKLPCSMSFNSPLT